MLSKSEIDMNEELDENGDLIMDNREIDMSKVAPLPFDIAWRDDNSFMNMGIIVDAEFKGNKGNVCRYGDMSESDREHVICIFFHQLEPHIGDYGEDTEGIDISIETAKYIVHAVNLHDRLVKALEELIDNPPLFRDYTGTDYDTCGYCHQPVEIKSHRHSDTCPLEKAKRLLSEARGES